MGKRTSSVGACVPNIKRDVGKKVDSTSQKTLRYGKGDVA